MWKTYLYAVCVSRTKMKPICPWASHLAVHLELLTHWPWTSPSPGLMLPISGWGLEMGNIKEEISRSMNTFREGHQCGCQKKDCVDTICLVPHTFCPSFLSAYVSFLTAAVMFPRPPYAQSLAFAFSSWANPLLPFGKNFFFEAIWHLIREDLIIFYLVQD